jgi:hypothetical protein
MHCKYSVPGNITVSDVLDLYSIAYRSGVTFGTVSLSRKAGSFADEPSIIPGLSTTFRTGAAHAVQPGAVVQNVAALHITLGRPHPLSGQKAASVSEEIAALRRLLFGFEPIETETGRWFNKALEGGNALNPESS